MTEDEKLKVMVDAYIVWCDAITFEERERTWVVYCIARDAYVGARPPMEGWTPAKPLSSRF